MLKISHLVNKDPLMKMAKDSLLNLPTPLSISFLWNMGFLLGMTLVLQILTGLVLSMNYVAFTDESFYSVIHIMRDVTGGWETRYLHMNGASLFFALMYSHIMRGLYFNSPSKTPMVWLSGLILFLSSMGAAFMGYVLPWGQMSFWGASVITSMISAIPYVGKDVTQWVWGGFAVSQPTLNRFFSLHFLLPMVVAILAMAHLIFLHEIGSSNPIGSNANFDKSKFFPLFLVKDLMPLTFISLFLIFLISLTPNILGDVENWTPAMITTTPIHIQPEWYFLFAYAILRAIPSKLGGVTAMLASVLFLAVPVIKKEKVTKKMSLKKILFWFFLSIGLLLTWVGANPVEPPFVVLSQFFTLIYFLLLMFL